MPKFVIDEDMRRSTGRVLKEQGYEVKDIRDHRLRGVDDKQFYPFTQEKQPVLITGDLGFSSIFDFPIGKHFGLVVPRFPNEMSTKELNRQLLERIRSLSEEDLRGFSIAVWIDGGLCESGEIIRGNGSGEAKGTNDERPFRRVEMENGLESSR